MEQYIPKSALVAEIESKKKCAQTLGDNAINSSMQQFYDGMKQGCVDILSSINTLEVKEVEKNVWKDNTEYPSEKDEDGYLLPIVACCNTWEDVICGEFKILELNIGDDTKTYRIDYLDWEYVVKWAYLKDVFPYRDSSILNYPVQFNETRRKDRSSLNSELTSHKAWEESLLYADRIRGSF